MITAPCKGVGGPGRTGYYVSEQRLSGFVGRISSHAPIDLFGSDVPPFPTVRPPFDRFLIQGYPGGPIYSRPQMGVAA